MATYTLEVENLLTKRYRDENATIEELSAELDLPRRNIIAKLSSMGIYKKKGYTTKRGEVPIRKEVYILNIARSLGLPPEQFESLEKVNKRVLELLNSKLNGRDAFYYADYMG